MKSAATHFTGLAQAPAGANLELWTGVADRPIETDWLTREEREQLHRFSVREASHVYAHTRRVLRARLADLLDCTPDVVSFRIGRFGKPYLKRNSGWPPIFFNVSHSGLHFGVAISAVGPVGFDLEVAQPPLDIEVLATRILSEREMSMWQGLDVAIKPRMFLWFWTRKEALLKGMGLGLSRDPRSVDVLDAQPSHRWCLVSFFDFPEYVATLAIKKSSQVRTRAECGGAFSTAPNFWYRALAPGRYSALLDVCGLHLAGKQILGPAD